MKRLSILLFLFIYVVGFSQTETPYVIQWEKTYDGDKNESINSTISTSDGGYLLGGDKRITYVGVPNDDFLVVKIDSIGIV